MSLLKSFIMTFFLNLTLLLRYFRATVLKNPSNKSHVLISVFQVPVEIMCTPTHTQHRRRTLPLPMPPGWTAGCSLKSKYGSRNINENDE